MSKIIKASEVEWGQWFKLVSNEPYERKFPKETVFQQYGKFNDYGDVSIGVRFYQLDAVPFLHSFKPDRLVILCDETTPLPVKLKEKLPALNKFVLVFSLEHKWQVAERINESIFKTAAEGYLIIDVTHWCDCPAEPDND